MAGNNQTLALNPDVAVIAGFWRRFAAFLIDALLLGAVGIALGFAFSDYFFELGSWGKLVGFLISLLYFGLSDSSLTKGQTLGKRLMSIRLGNAVGAPLTLLQASSRYVIFGVPYFMNGAVFGGDAIGSWIETLISICVFGLGLSIVYLLIFNRRTRQSLHDLLTDSYVLMTGGNIAPPSTKPWKGHFVVVALIFLIAALAPLLVDRLTHVAPFGDLIAVQKSLQSQPEVRNAGVVVGSNFVYSAQSGSKSSRSVSSTIFLAKRISDYDSLANKVARITLDNYPDAAAKDFVSVAIIYGYDIGIASSWTTRNFSFAPSQWRDRISVESNKIL